VLSTGLKPLRRPAAVRKVQEPAATPPWLELPNAAHLSDISILERSEALLDEVMDLAPSEGEPAAPEPATPAPGTPTRY